MFRWVTAASLVALGVASLAWATADWTRVLPLWVERGVAQLLLVLFVGLVMAAAWRLDHRTRPARRDRPWIAFVLFLSLGLVLSGAIRFGKIPTFLQTGWGYGPLTVWPALRAGWSLSRVSIDLTLGHLIIAATTALVMAFAWSRIRHGCGLVRQQTTPVGQRAVPRWRAWLQIAPTFLLPAACPGCLPVLAMIGLTATVPALAAYLGPTSALSVLLTLSAPVVALVLLAWSTRTPATRAWGRTSDTGVRDRYRVRRLVHTVFVPRVPATPRRVTTLLTLVFLVLLGSPLAAAFGGLPRGRSGRQDLIYDLMVLTTIGAVLLTALTIGVMLYLTIRYRVRDPDEAPPRGTDDVGPRASSGSEPAHTAKDRKAPDPTLPTGARRMLLSSFIAIPVLAIFGIGIVSLDVLQTLEAVPEEGLEIDVMASQFTWRFTYPDGTTTLHELYVPKGEVVLLNVSSSDVLHSFFVPDMGVKQDANPGKSATTWFEPQRVGTYAIYCAEWCGPSHPDMRGMLVVLPEGSTVPPEGAERE